MAAHSYKSEYEPSCSNFRATTSVDRKLHCPDSENGGGDVHVKFR